MLVHKDNTMVVSYISHHSLLHLHPIFREAQHILLWAEEKFLSLKAVLHLGHINMRAGVMSRQEVRPRECQLHPQVYDIAMTEWKWIGDNPLSPLVCPHTSSSVGSGCHGTGAGDNI